MNSSGKPPFHQRTRKNLKESKSITVFIPKEETLVKIAKRNKSRSRKIASMNPPEISSLLTQGGVLFPTSKTPLKVMKDTSLALCLEPL
jgi:hypothetical protein